MKVRISDLVEHYPDANIDLKEHDNMDKSVVKRMTLQKVHASKPARRLPKLAVIAAVLAACMLCTVTVFACVQWSGFALTDGLSRAQLRTLLKEDVGTVQRIDQDGTVHYLDAQGNELFALSEEEALQYERSRQEAREREVQASTDLLDVRTATLVPMSITELSPDVDGNIPDFALGNGHMLLLHPDDADGYVLKKGDIVCIRLDANDACILEFGMVRDAAVIESATAKAQQHEHTFTIPKDGAYCFTLMYYSSDKSAFTNATLTIN